MTFRFAGGWWSFRTAPQFTLSQACSPVMSRSQAKTPKPILVLRLIAEAPANRFEFFQAANARIEDEADEANDQHGGHHQVVPLTRVARINNQVAQAGVDRDHFRSYHHEPGDAERDA